MAFEELLVRAGGVGLFQVLQICTLFLSAVFVPFHMILENFSAAVPDHRCWTPVLDNSSEVPANLTREALLAISIPPGPNLQPHRCRRFRHPQWQFLDPNTTAANGSEAATEPCMDGWVYDHSTFTATVVTRWDLVCSSQSLKPLGQSIFMAGILAGAFVWGFLSYRLGRKPMLNWCYLQVAVAGAGAMLAPSFFTYCGLRFLSAFALAGTILAQSTLMAEWTTTRRRAVTMAILGCSYSTGQMALAGLAYAVRDWQNLQLAVSIPFLATFLLSWWLPESARWLITTGQPEKALQELQKVARINGHKEAKETLTIEVRATSSTTVELLFITTHTIPNITIGIATKHYHHTSYISAVFITTATIIIPIIIPISTIISAIPTILTITVIPTLLTIPIIIPTNIIVLTIAIIPTLPITIISTIPTVSISPSIITILNITTIIAISTIIAMPTKPSVPTTVTFSTITNHISTITTNNNNTTIIICLTSDLNLCLTHLPHGT
ncbi:Solute carrier family 22 member 11 [Microtus ochrogaster]|uniref:Solute carrier family 22 member 11 n=1 Tax=Microtus ochrogaster TaxID=79684 RepID=A0A8J6GCY8_MICOH|nr:Solute carrier family 22 member 11 [Microtus ochrogaster]